MSPTGTIAKTDGLTDRPQAPDPLAELDASCQLPVLYFLLSGLAWLLVGSLLQFEAGVRLLYPDWGASCLAMSYGRLVPAAENALVYGFASQMGLGIGLWLLARLGRTPLVASGLIAVGNVLWNFALTIGILGILLGDSTGHAGLEMPAYSHWMLLAAYLFVGIWAVQTWARHSSGPLYASQWFLLGALFWFPWLLTTAQLVVVTFPGRGVLPAITGAWFAGGIQHLWLTPLALAAIYYFIPAITGRPLRNYHLAVIAFWSLALFGAWSGPARLIGGPIPAWIVSVGIVATVLLLIPVTIVALNIWPVLGSRLGQVCQNRVLRFLAVAVVCFVLVSLGNALNAFRSRSAVTHLTLNEWARSFAYLHGFVALTFLGAAYHVVPRLMRRDWPSARLMSVHFWFTVVGLVLVVIPALMTGFRQGRELNDAAVPVAKVFEQLRSVFGWRVLGFGLMGAGNLAFLTHFGWLLIRCWTPGIRSAAALFTAEAGQSVTAR